MSDINNPVQKAIIEHILHGKLPEPCTPGYLPGINLMEYEDAYDLANYIAALRKASNLLEEELGVVLERYGDNSDLKPWVELAMGDWKEKDKYNL